MKNLPIIDRMLNYAVMDYICSWQRMRWKPSFHFLHLTNKTKKVLNLLFINKWSHKWLIFLLTYSSVGCCGFSGLFGHVLKVFLLNVSPVSVAGIFRGQESEPEHRQSSDSCPLKMLNIWRMLKWFSTFTSLLITYIVTIQQTSTEHRQSSDFLPWKPLRRRKSGFYFDLHGFPNRLWHIEKEFNSTPVLYHGPVHTVKAHSSYIMW